MWITIPAETIDYKATFNKNPDEVADTDTEAIPVKNNQSNTALIAGVLLIIAGLLFLADRLIPFYNLIDFWPVILIIAGVLVIKPDLFKTTPVKEDDTSSDTTTETTDIVTPKNIES